MSLWWTTTYTQTYHIRSFIDDDDDDQHPHESFKNPEEEKKFKNTLFIWCVENEEFNNIKKRIVSPNRCVGFIVTIQRIDWLMDWLWFTKSKNEIFFFL